MLQGSSSGLLGELSGKLPGGLSRTRVQPTAGAGVKPSPILDPTTRQCPSPDSTPYIPNPRVAPGLPSPPKCFRLRIGLRKRAGDLGRRNLPGPAIVRDADCEGICIRIFWGLVLLWRGQLLK